MSGVECCAEVSVRSAISSLRRRITELGRRCVRWLSSCTTRLRDVVARRSDEDPRLDGGWRTVVGRVAEAARPALGGCRRVVGRRLADACGHCGRSGTARLRDSLSFWRATLAEFVGTFFLVVIGCGSATEAASYSPAQQNQHDRAVRMALAFGINNAFSGVSSQRNAP